MCYMVRNYCHVEIVMMLVNSFRKHLNSLLNLLSNEQLSERYNFIFVFKRISDIFLPTGLRIYMGKYKAQGPT